MERRLYKDDLHKKIGGVCAGLAEYFNVDVTLVRVLFVLTLILHGTGLVAYIVLWVCLPKKPYSFANPVADYKVPPDNPFGNVPPVMNPAEPFGFAPPVKRSKGGLIFGIVLLILGGFFLLDEFNFVPDLDIENTWPIILIIVGVVMVAAGAKKNPWERDNWHSINNDDKKEEQTINDNPPTA